MTTTGQPVSLLRTPTALRAWTLVWWAAALGLGANTGRQIAAYAVDMSWIGWFALALNTMIHVATAALLVVIPGLVGAFLYRVVLKRALPRAETVLRVVALFAAGLAVGFLVTPKVIIEHNGPINLETWAAGTMTLGLDGQGGYVMREDVFATCVSTSDGEALSSVAAGEVGTIDRAEVMAVLSGIELEVSSVTFHLEPAPGSAYLEWSGPVEFVDRNVGDRDGRFTFVNARLVAPAESAQPHGDWPATLSGALTWSCGELHP